MYTEWLLEHESICGIHVHLMTYSYAVQVLHQILYKLVHRLQSQLELE